MQGGWFYKCWENYNCYRKALPLLGVRSIGRVTQKQETDRKPAGRSKASPFFLLQPCSPLSAEPNMELVGKTKLVCRVYRRIALKLRNKSLRHNLSNCRDSFMISQVSMQNTFWVILLFHWSTVPKLLNYYSSIVSFCIQ